MGALFGAGAKLVTAGAVGGVNHIGASFTSLYAEMDRKGDVWNGAESKHSEAQLLANLTVIPAVVWAVVWSAVAVAMLALGLYLALRGGKKKPAPGLTPLTPQRSR